MLFRAFALFLLCLAAGFAAGEPAAIRVGVLSQAEMPKGNTSQGLYISILKTAGMEARAISAEAVKAGALDALDVFIIGLRAGAGRPHFFTGISTSLRRIGPGVHGGS